MFDVFLRRLAAADSLYVLLVTALAMVALVALIFRPSRAWLRGRVPLPVIGMGLFCAACAGAPMLGSAAGGAGVALTAANITQAAADIGDVFGKVLRTANVGVEAAGKALDSACATRGVGLYAVSENVLGLAGAKPDVWSGYGVFKSQLDQLCENPPRDLVSALMTALRIKTQIEAITAAGAKT